MVMDTFKTQWAQKWLVGSNIAPDHCLSRLNSTEKNELSLAISSFVYTKRTDKSKVNVLGVLSFEANHLLPAKD